MKVLVFGASGQTGHELVRQALRAGHVVTAYARRPDAVGSDSRVRVVEGDIVDATAVARVVQDQEAVLSALGAPTPVWPYPAFRTGVANIVSAMEQGGVSRLIYLSFLGVQAGEGRLGFFLEQVASRLLRHSIADHRANEQAIRASQLRWTIVYPPRLTNGRRSGAFRSGEDVPVQSLLPSISRGDVAEFMLRQLTDEAFVRRSPRVMH
jgi:uncharacterized protein YbjT (DUF2867 family)